MDIWITETVSRTEILLHGLSEIGNLPKESYWALLFLLATFLLIWALIAAFSKGPIADREFAGRTWIDKETARISLELADSLNVRNDQFIQITINDVTPKFQEKFRVSIAGRRTGVLKEGGIQLNSEILSTLSNKKSVSKADEEAPSESEAVSFSEVRVSKHGIVTPFNHSDQSIRIGSWLSVVILAAEVFIEFLAPW